MDAIKRWEKPPGHPPDGTEFIGKRDPYTGDPLPRGRHTVRYTSGGWPYIQTIVGAN